ncbi:MAG: class II aldolase/adducin family protein [Anaerolineae bacterium]|uniref:class II aldolase/adducin family protein n=1 Tax=Thermoflexus sp. TaxID=1969742 RepID=UPI0025D055F1|nr:class II aldolase/adducin family protein [Thermoflexus sp.]MCS7350762.1 class II aldolase/adducin family protein [Thermoflexus sp.]MDW8180213.1 class II aldolase/adducin family protein [Anaerolineae bacterium]
MRRFRWGLREQRLREALVEIGARLYARGLISANDGNFSVRLDARRILITPRGRSKGWLRPEDVVVLDMEGRVLEMGYGGAGPSSEWPMHIEAYRQRPDIAAVLHAHPPFTVALTVSGVPFPSEVLLEVVMTIGKVPTARLAVPSSEDDALAIREWIRDHQAVLLPHHGVVTIGRTLEEAWVILERIEYAAKVYLLSRVLGEARPLPPEFLAVLTSAG